MQVLKHTNRKEMTEFEREWHHLRTARTVLEWAAIAALLAGVGYVLWPWMMH